MIKFASFLIASMIILSSCLVFATGDERSADRPISVDSPDAYTDQVRDNREIGTVSTHFIQWGAFELPLTDLVLRDVPGLGLLLEREELVRLNTMRQEYAVKKEEILVQRAEVTMNARAYQEAVLNQCRVVEAIRYSGGLDQPFDTLYQMAGAQYNLDGANREAVSRGMTYYRSLFKLQDSEETLRKTATSYYELVLFAFSGVPDDERRNLLDWFAKRTESLHQERLKYLNRVEDTRRNQWLRMRERLMREGKTLLGEAATQADPLRIFLNWIFRDKPESDSGEKGSYPLAEADEAAKTAFTTLRAEWDARVYNWLAQESAVHFDLHAGFLRVHEKARSNSELFPVVYDRIRENRQEPDAAEKDLRLALFRLRAERARLQLFKERLTAEATYRQANSIWLGLDKLWQDTSRRFLAIGRGDIVVNENFRSGTMTVQVAALAATAYKVSGESLSLLVTTPLENGFIELVFKPVAQALGGDLETSVDTQWERYQSQSEEIRRRESLINYLRRDMTYDEGMNFIQHLCTQRSQGRSIATMAPMTVRFMLEDPAFISGSSGGLPVLFDILAHRHQEYRALQLHAARYELDANLGAAAVRLSASRGRAIEDSDLKVSSRLVDEMLGRVEREPAMINADLLFQTIPFAREFKTLSDLPQTVRNTILTLTGDIGSQDEYMAKQQGFSKTLTALIRDLAPLDYDYTRLKVRSPESYRHHLELLADCGEYVKAYRMIFSDHSRMAKIMVDINERDPDGSLTSEGRTRLAGIQKSEDLELSGLAYQAAELKLAYHALTGNFAAAAIQCRELHNYWNRYLEEKNDKQRVDLEPIALKFEGLAVNEEIVQVYSSLYSSTLKQVCFSMVNDALADHIMGVITRRYGKVYLRQKAADSVSSRLLGAFNPWVGKFSTDGVLNTLDSAFQNALAKSAGQAISSMSYMIERDSAEAFFDALLNIGTSTFKTVYGNIQHADLEWTLAETDYSEREKTAARARQDLESVYTELLRPALTDLEAPESQIGRRERGYQIAHWLESFLNDPRLKLARGEFVITNEAYRQAKYRRDRVRREALAAARHTEGSLHQDAALRRRKGAESRSPEEISAVIQSSYGLLLQRMGEKESIDMSVISQLADPQILKHLMFREGGMDIDTVRDAIRSAIKNNPDQEAAIREIAEKIDAHRRELVNDLLEKFNATEEARGVVRIIQVGASHGNPEHQGLFGDTDLTALTNPDADVDQAKLKQSLLDFFAANGILLATPEQHSTMDTEIFTQPMHGEEWEQLAFRALVQDVDVKRGDATRFGSLGMDGWVKNSMAFSSLTLAGDIEGSMPWRNLKPQDGYGGAVEMSSYMADILTDPALAPDTFKSLSAEAQRDLLTHVFDKTKYFVRLADTYVISQEDGNRRYNDRQKRAGRNLSLHSTIAEDFESIAGEGRAFNQRDAANFHLLSQMKLKGQNPDPWALIPGETPDQKIKAAGELFDWMRETYPRLMAEVGHAHRQVHQRAVMSGDENELARFQEDGIRTGVQILNMIRRQPYGVAALLAPPPEEGDDVRSEHSRTIREAMDKVRENRARLQEISDRPYETVRRQFQSSQPLDPEAYDRITNLIRDANQTRVDMQFEHETEGGSAMRYWMTRGSK